LADYERVVARVVEALQGRPGVTASRSFPGVAGQPLPRALVRIDSAHAGTTRDAVVRALWEGDPRIALTTTDADGFYVNPHYLTAEDAALVLARLEAALTPPARPGGRPPSSTTRTATASASR
jgi:L-seryl-tRNA(Ser) seleniumtransferase